MPVLLLVQHEVCGWRPAGADQGRAGQSAQGEDVAHLSGGLFDLDDFRENLLKPTAKTKISTTTTVVVFLLVSVIFLNFYIYFPAFFS